MATEEKNRQFFPLLQEHFISANIGETAVLMAYYILLSIFPLMIALGNILPILNIDPAEIMPYLNEVVPEAISSILSPILEQLLTSGNGGLFSLGMIAVIWAASNGVGQLEKGLDLAYGITDKRHNIVQKAMSVLAVILMLVLVIVTILVFGLGSVLLDQLAASIPAFSEVAATLTDLRWPVTVGLLLCFLILVYMWAPAAKVRIRDAVPGTVFAVLGWMLLVVTFSLYLELTARSLNAYGVLSTFFILMFWLNFACIIILLGAVLNATIYEYRFGEVELKENPITQKISDKIEELPEKVMKKFAKPKEPKKPAQPEEQTEPEELAETENSEKK